MGVAFSFLHLKYSKLYSTTEILQVLWSSMPSAMGLSQPKNRNMAITGEDAVVEKKRKILEGIKVSSI